MKDHKNAIINALEAMRKKETADKQVWKARAYSKVIKALKDFPQPVTSFDDISSLPGIGEKIAEKIKEIIETGKLHQVEEIENNASYGIIEELLNVHGIGPAKAQDLVRKHGIKSIADLIERQAELLNDKQKLGLKYYKDILQRIPRKEMDKHNTFIIETIKAIDPKLKVTLAGSYRRGDPTSGDIDVLVTYPFDYKPGPTLMKEISKSMVEKKYVADILAEGDKKYMSVCRLKYHRVYRRLDIMLTKPTEYPFAVLYFTGSGPFNVAMRQYALSKGYSLNEYGLKKISTGEMMDCRFDSEEDIFRFLDLKYIAPHERVQGVTLEMI